MLPDYLLFLAKTLTWVIALLILAFGIAIIASKGKPRNKDKLEVRKINEHYHDLEHAIQEKLLKKHLFKKFYQEKKKQQKLHAKDETVPKRIFLLNFVGDIKASAIKHFRQEVTAALMVATAKDEVVLRLESPGGIVPGYGLAASQLQRIRERKIPLTVTIDKFAASGGYMMAAVANKILAAPFAIVGSIGVIAQIPNFHRLLKKNDIEFEQIMAGQYKRTLTLFGENTEQGREKLQEEVNETQELFKSFVVENRPIVDIEKVATGEHWYGQKALELKLVDELITSDDYLLKASESADIYELSYCGKKSVMEKLSSQVHKGLSYCFNLLNAKHNLTH